MEEATSLQRGGRRGRRASAHLAWSKKKLDIIGKRACYHASQHMDAWHAPIRNPHSAIINQLYACTSPAITMMPVATMNLGTSNLGNTGAHSVCVDKLCSTSASAAQVVDTLQLQATQHGHSPKLCMMVYVVNGDCGVLVCCASCACTTVIALIPLLTLKEWRSHHIPRLCMCSRHMPKLHLMK